MGETVKEMLVRQGIEAGRAGNTGRHGMRSARSAGKSAHSQVPAGEEKQPMGNSEKGRAVNAPAKFTGLHVIVDNSRCMPLRDPTRSAQRGSGIHLVLA